MKRSSLNETPVHNISQNSLSHHRDRLIDELRQIREAEAQLRAFIERKDAVVDELIAVQTALGELQLKPAPSDVHETEADVPAVSRSVPNSGSAAPTTVPDSTKPSTGESTTSVQPRTRNPRYKSGDRVFIHNYVGVRERFRRDENILDRAGVVTGVSGDRIEIWVDASYGTWRLAKNIRHETDQDRKSIAKYKRAHNTP